MAELNTAPTAPGSTPQQVSIEGDINLGDVMITPDGPVSQLICVSGVTGYRHGTTEAGVITWDGYDLGDGMLAGDPPDGFTWGACPVVLPADDPRVCSECRIDLDNADTHYVRRYTVEYDPVTGQRTDTTLGTFDDDEVAYTPTANTVACTEHGAAAVQTTVKRKTLVGPATWPAAGDLTAMLYSWKWTAIEGQSQVDDGHGNTSILFEGETDVADQDSKMPFLQLPTLTVPAGSTVNVLWSEIAP